MMLTLLLMYACVQTSVLPEDRGFGYTSSTPTSCAHMGQEVIYRSE